MAEPTLARKPLAQAQLGNALADVYVAPTQPANGVVLINSMTICNSDTASRTLTFRMGPAGTLTSANGIFEGVVIPANTTWIFSGSEWGLNLSFGWHFAANADVAAKVTLTLGGAEIS